MHAFAMEAVKVIVGMGRPLSERLYHYDALEGRACVMQLPPRRRDCAVCGKTPSITSMSDSQAFLDAHGLVHGGESAPEVMEHRKQRKLEASWTRRLMVLCGSASVDYFKELVWGGRPEPRKCER